ncbi:hypothetical protein J4221_03505 [Candidatus Pacearchaeota archaeon]|nr:hypothetical protein [Candidatus Pacearchaeota archaeon]
MGLLDYLFPMKRNEMNFPLSDSFLKVKMYDLYHENKNRISDNRRSDYTMSDYKEFVYDTITYCIYWNNIPRKTLLRLESLLKEGKVPQIKFQSIEEPYSSRSYRRSYVGIWYKKVVYPNSHSTSFILWQGSFELNQ